MPRKRTEPPPPVRHHVEPNPKLFTIHDVSAALKLSEAYVRLLIYRGDIPSIKLGRSRRVRVVDLDTFIAGLPTFGREAA